MWKSRRAEANDTASNENQDPTPPDGGYGWVCVAACFAINCFTWGIVSSYGVYLTYYLIHGSFPGARPLDYAFIGGSNFAAAMLCAPLATFLARRYGSRPPMFCGIFIMAGGLAGASFATTTWHLYLTQGALVGLGIGLVYIPSMAILSQWFLRRRSLANGITTAGSGLGGIIFSLGTSAMIDSISVQWSLRINAIIALIMTSAAIFKIKDRNKIVQPKQHPFDTELLRRGDVWLLLMWAFFGMFGYITLLYSLPDFALSIKLSQSQATEIITLLHLGTAVGRPFIGVLSDRYGRVKVAAMLTFSCGAACFLLWLPARTYSATVLFAIISGAILGVFWSTIAPLCADAVGLQDLPSLLSLSWLMTVLPTFFSEAIALELRRVDANEPYLYPQIFAGLSYLIASTFLFELHRRRGQSETEESLRLHTL